MQGSVEETAMNRFEVWEKHSKRGGLRVDLEAGGPERRSCSGPTEKQKLRRRQEMDLRQFRE